MDMDVVDTKTNTKCFKDPMYAIFLKISGCKDFKYDMDNGHGHVGHVGHEGHGHGGHEHGHGGLVHGGHGGHGHGGHGHDGHGHGGHGHGGHGHFKQGLGPKGSSVDSILSFLLYEQRICGNNPLFLL